eukprot:gene12512-biopygen8827
MLWTWHLLPPVYKTWEIRAARRAARRAAPCGRVAGADAAVRRRAALCAVWAAPCGTICRGQRCAAMKAAGPLAQLGSNKHK